MRILYNKWIDSKRFTNWPPKKKNTEIFVLKTFVKRIWIGNFEKANFHFLKFQCIIYNFSIAEQKHTFLKSEFCSHCFRSSHLLCNDLKIISDIWTKMLRPNTLYGGFFFLRCAAYIIYLITNFFIATLLMNWSFSLYYNAWKYPKIRVSRSNSLNALKM